MDSATKLDSIDIPHWQVVLDEIFCLPPAGLFPGVGLPATLGELAARTGLTVAEVSGRIGALLRLSRELEISAAALAALPAAAVLVVDMRWPRELAPAARWPGAWTYASGDFAELWPRLVAAPHVV